MNSIYLNNFRGISDTIINVFPINFLLGENSTGKTSVLSALTLLSSTDFWLNLNFNTGDYDFGGYSDIVSVSSHDKSEFQIGIYKEDEDNESLSACYMLHFREGNDGLPKLVRFSQLCLEHLVTLQISPKQIKAYGTKKVPSCVNNFELASCFEYLRNIPNTIKEGYKVFSGEFKRIIRRSHILILPEIVERLFPDQKTKSDDFSPFPTLTNRRLASLAPIRTKPKRTYDGYTQRYSPEGEHTPYIIRANIRKKGESSFRAALDIFGKESGLFSTIGVSQFGKDSSAPFELIVNLSDNSPLRINSVGYGVSQVLPVVVELLDRPNETWFAVQQPEVHLHPRAQAALGDVFFQAALTQEKVLFIETHSDYLIDRLRLNYKEHNPGDQFAQILFFERVDAENKISQINILPNGEYPENQPKGFRAFFLEEQRKILGF